MAKARVLVVDDSPVVRHALSSALRRDPDIEVVGAAADPYEARDLIVSLRPDVLTLDVEMPRMDGITFLRKLMERFPVPTLMVSGVTPRGCALALEALEAGAVDVIEKPALAGGEALRGFGERLARLVKAAARSRRPEPRPAAPAPAPPPLPPAAGRRRDRLIALGASTGGTEALRAVLGRMPADCPPILAVQHMPGAFTRAFADRLNRHCAIEVLEAEDGLEARPGRAIIAQGDQHLLLRRSGPGWAAETRGGEPVCRHRPSVEVLFQSFARTLGDRGLGAILTGMGRDGADGLRAMRDAGARTVAQDERSCVVFGMPKAAIKAGGAEKVVPLDRVAETLLSMA